MLARQRQERILHEVDRHGGSRVSELVDILGVSDMTVRRDIEALAEKGLVRKVHGGATSVGGRSADEPGFQVKSEMHPVEKSAIARTAAAMIDPGASIAISAGTTAYAVAHELRNVADLTVVTNSPRVAELLHDPSRDDLTVILTGGVRTPSDALAGPVAVAALRTLHVDTLVLGVHGIDERAGLTTPNLVEAETNRALIAAAQARARRGRPQQVGHRRALHDRHAGPGRRPGHRRRPRQHRAPHGQPAGRPARDRPRPHGAGGRRGLVGTGTGRGPRVAPLRRLPLAPRRTGPDLRTCMTTTRPARLRRTSTTLADGRELIYFDDTEPWLSGAVSRDADDHRPLGERAAAGEMRLDPLTGDWVAIAGHRLNRTFLPPADECPLCPTGRGTVPSEIPAADYDVVVFENRFPSFSAVAGAPGPSGEPLLAERPAHGRCEVVCFTSDHGAAFASLTPARARTVIDAWADRTAALSAIDEVEQVFCFENRGQEIGVTLHHPHGQIYAYPYVAPRTRQLLAQARAHHERTGRLLGCRHPGVRAPRRLARRPVRAALDRLRAVRRALAGRGAPRPAPRRARPGRARGRGARRAGRGLPRPAPPPRPLLRRRGR